MKEGGGRTKSRLEVRERRKIERKKVKRKASREIEERGEKEEKGVGGGELHFSLVLIHVTTPSFASAFRERETMGHGREGEGRRGGGTAHRRLIKLKQRVCHEH